MPVSNPPQAFSNPTVSAITLAVVALTDGATINTDASLGNTFSVTLGGNRTIANPTNPRDGQRLSYQLRQDATGSRTVTWGSAFRFGRLIPTPGLTQTAAKTDLITFQYNAIDGKWDCVEVMLAEGIFTIVTFSYTGAAQTWLVPAGVTSVIVDAYGAQGAPGQSGHNGTGGSGGRTKCTLVTVPGETLQVNVGGASTTYAGGFNGGGTGTTAGKSGGGGGASDVRRGAYALLDRLVVAGGGGGGGDNVSGSNNGGSGGSGGGTVGTGGSNSGDVAFGGGGGTQSAGGGGGANYNFLGGGSSTGGVLGIGGVGGGAGGTGGAEGGNGGGGYYGGGGGGGCGTNANAASAGAGGGSGLSTGVEETLGTGVRTGNGVVTIAYNAS